MNISINFVKTVAIGAVLLLVFSTVFIVNAAVTLNSATLSDDNVEPGDAVTVNVSVNKTGNACDNNFGFTRVTVDGNVYESSRDSYTGTGTVLDSVGFNAPAVDGVYEVEVEIYNGVEDGVSCSEQLWASDTLTLTVETVIDPYIQVLGISPIDEERVVGDTNPVKYIAKVEVGGTPDSATLQCVIFDIFNNDNWQTVSVNLGAGTHQVEFDYDISGFAVGEYDVVAIASEESCTNATDGDFTTDDFRANGNTQFDAETKLFIVEPQAPTYCVEGNVWGDENQNGVATEGTPDGEETPKVGWIVKIADTEGVVYDTTETDASGNYELCAPAGNWVITQEAPEEGWTYSYPSDGKWEITLPVLAQVSFLDQVVSFFIPTALAAPAVGANNLNFGVFQRAAAYSQGSYSSGGGNGVRIELTDDGDDDRDEDEDEEDEDRPEGEVLGESTSVVPVGAPNTGAGGASSASLDLHTVAAILAVRRSVRATHGN